MNQPEDRFVGCLLGLAVGDALGMPAEGCSPAEIRKLFAEGLCFLADERRFLKKGQFTDDTQLALCCVDSILATGGVDTNDIADRFLDMFLRGELRGIGRSTVESLLRLKSGVYAEEAGEEGFYAAGNGVAMRIAPVGLLFAFVEGDIYDDVRKASVMTHRNEEAIAGGHVVAEVVRRCAGKDMGIGEAAQKALERIDGTKVAERLREALKMLEKGVGADDAVWCLGTSGYVVETVASAVYVAAFCGENFTEAMRVLIFAGGDTDTTAAICGALIGAKYGKDVIPQALCAGVERGEEIEQKARRLYEAALALGG